MALKLTHERLENYLFVRLEGGWTEEAVQQAIDDIAELARTHGHLRVLVDALNLSAPSTDLKRYLAGEHIAKRWRQLKVSIAYPEKLITGFTEDTAANRGAYMVVFPDLASAERWLTNDSPKPLRAT